ncbi:hypothetical protein OG226_12070 [Streptomyces sp. NBC_01261]|uniref:hypothetical protein n=1 Tax=Streptomyces sp. NBC_01261 TaxID=2903802 RepID=UPI002E340DD2|nr:hypothetical protein [Streptomyces sp. NBC_01261]
MPAPDHDSRPDVAVGHHLDYGIVAANPKQLAASTWMLKRLDFHPVHGHPTLHALTDQQRDGQERATRAVALLRKVGYRVDADAAFDPSLARAAPAARHQRPHAEPDIAFAEHPQLGIVASAGHHFSATGGRLALLDEGWRHDPNAGVYTLPTTIGRTAALKKVANVTSSMHRSGLRTVAEPLLAQDLTPYRQPTSAPAAPRERGQGPTTDEFSISAAALASSPARASLADKAPGPAPATAAPAAQPVDPRIAFSRNR